MSDADRQPDRVVLRLFARLQAIYGHRWASQFPTADDGRAMVMREWAIRLAGLSHEEIAKGLRGLHKRHGSDRGWPPNPIEFRELCRPARQPHERPEFQARALPSRPVDPAVGDQALAEIRRRLQMGSQATGAAS